MARSRPRRADAARGRRAHVRRRSRVARPRHANRRASAPARPRLEMAVRDDMLNGHEICHGGFITTLADSAFAFACNSRNERHRRRRPDGRLPRAGARAATCSPPTRSRSRAPAAPASTTSSSPTAPARASPWSAAARRGSAIAPSCPSPPPRRRDDIAPPLARRARADRARQPRRAAARCSSSACAGACSMPTTTFRTTGARSTPRASIPSDLKELADLARFPFTVKGDLRDNYPFGMFAVPRERRRAHPRLVGHDRQADRRRLHAAATSTPGPTWSRARSAPPAAGRATWSTSPTATASSPAASARTTAPSAPAAP